MVTTRRWLLLHALLGCLALSGPGRGLGRAQATQNAGWGAANDNGIGWGEEEDTLEQGGLHNLARRLLFDVEERLQMETLRAAEEHQRAVMDGRSNPLFSHRTVFDTHPTPTLFGGKTGSPTILKERELRQQQLQREAEAAGVAAVRSAGPQGAAALGGEHAALGAAAGSQQQQLPAQTGSREPAPIKQAPSLSGGDTRQGQHQQQQVAPGGGSGAPARHRAPTPTPLSLLLDAVEVEEGGQVPEPELQFKDEGGVRILIWLPQDTLPRDLLLGKRPQVWLYTLLPTDYDAAALLPHFIDHYMRLGVHPANMLFVVNHDPTLGAAAPATGLRDTTALLDGYGLDYRVWRGRYSEEAHLKHMLQVLARVPVRDWVLNAAIDELQEYGGLTAHQFLAQMDAEGVNWVRGVLVDRVSATGALAAVDAAPSLFKQFPLKCDVSRRVAHAPGSKVAAFKAFLRPGVGFDPAMGITEARKYFGAAPAGEESPRHGMCGGEDLLPLTPYDRYWKFYKAPDVAGNSYLWDAREGELKVKVHHFMWRASVGRSIADRLQRFKEESELCGSAGQAQPVAWQEAQRVSDTVLSKGAIDVANGYLKCQLAEDPRMPVPRIAKQA